MRLIKYLFIFGLVCGVLAAIGVAGVVWHFSRDLPSTEGLRDVRLQVPLRIYSADQQLIGEYGAERREPLDYGEIPEPLIRAFLAAEDDRFFKHPGVDYQGLLRAAWVLALTGEKAQGGSTITMQLARNFFLSSEKSYVRKVREILLALQMERQLSKQEILTFYLNKIFLGHRAYGIGAAAKVYYGKELDDLSLAQMAMIAGLPKAPSRYNPISGPQRALLRRNYVLRRMLELDYIDQAQFDLALEEPISAELRRATIDVEAHYVAEYARGRIINQFGLDAYTSGIEVMTTIDGRSQQAAIAALRKHLISYDIRHGYRGPEAKLGDLGEQLDGLDAVQLESLLGPMLEEFSSVGGLEAALVLHVDDSRIQVWSSDSGLVDLDPAAQPYDKLNEVLAHGDLVRLQAQSEQAQPWVLAQVPEVQGALVALDPETGAVQAMSGGFDYFASKFNRAMQAQRQPGSSFKPFVYSAALENGFTPASVINDAPVVFHDEALGGAWRPQNYSGRFYGPTPLRTGLYNSRNLVAIRVLEAAGLDTVRNYVTRFGFDRERVPRDLSMVLGTGVFSPMEMAGAYAVFANGGYRIEPYLIEQVRTSEGEILHQAMPPSVCEARCQRQREEQLKAQAELQEVRDALGTAALSEADAQRVEFPPDAERAIEAANAYVMTDMLRDVVKRGTARRALQLGRDDLAGKTGTTNDQIDAWFCGFNAQHVAVSWVGFDDIKSLGARETGSKAALPMWMDYMAVALDGVPSQIRPQPAGVVSARVDPETGLLSSYGSAQSKFEIFIEGHLPEAADYGYGAQDSGVNEGQSPSREDELLEDIF